jgi:8-oxo-dGTP pyrophosphatase MutT (NUDIX family)
MFDTKPPADFVPTMNIVICYCIYQDKILFLRRKKDKVEGQKWTAPGGKKEKDESLPQAICREVKEETGITLTEEQLEDTGDYYIKISPNICYTIQIYKTELSSLPQEIELNQDEHDQYKWVTKEEALNLQLISKGDRCLLSSFNFSSSKF